MVSYHTLSLLEIHMNFIVIKGELNYGRDGLILLIDATKPMFQVNKIGESPFKMCLKVTIFTWICVPINFSLNDKISTMMYTKNPVMFY